MEEIMEEINDPQNAFVKVVSKKKVSNNKAKAPTLVTAIRAARPLIKNKTNSASSILNLAQKK